MKTTQNMTTGSPVRHIILFSIPMMIGNIIQQLYNLADSIVVGRVVGRTALGAIGATGSVTFLFFALCNGIGSGGGVITSQYFGRDDKKKVKRCIFNVALIMLIFPLIVGAAAFFLSRPLLILLDTPETMLPDAVTYMQMMSIGLVFVSLYNYISSMLRALGDSMTPLMFLIFASLVNIGLDITFVKFLGLGVLGAALATLISQFLSGVLCLLFAIRTNPYFHLEKKDMHYDRKVVKDSLRLGIPLSLQFSMIAVSCMALQRVVNGFGDIAVTAFTATSRIEQVIHQPYQTLSAALSTYSGQNYGANKKDRVIEGYRKSLLIMAIFTLIMIPVLQFFGEDIVSLFLTDEPEVIRTGAIALRISSLFYLFLGVIYVARGVLSGIGDAFFALLNGIVEVIGRFTIPLFLTAIPMIGTWGIWWSVGIVWFVSGLTAWLRYVQKMRELTGKKLIPDRAAVR